MNRKVEMGLCYDRDGYRTWTTVVIEIPADTPEDLVEQKARLGLGGLPWLNNVDPNSQYFVGSFVYFVYPLGGE